MVGHIALYLFKKVMVEVAQVNSGHSSQSKHYRLVEDVPCGELFIAAEYACRGGISKVMSAVAAYAVFVPGGEPLQNCSPSGNQKSMACLGAGVQ